MVVMNYRMGAFGFVYLGTKDVLGNFGLEDQITAITWVRNNIAAFGGDPSRITLMGQSAGAMSISCHMSRPQVRGRGHWPKYTTAVAFVIRGLVSVISCVCFFSVTRCVTVCMCVCVCARAREVDSLSISAMSTDVSSTFHWRRTCTLISNSAHVFYCCCCCFTLMSNPTHVFYCDCC